jgi:hypothetical protein
MHIYNWYHSDSTGIHYVHEYVTVYFRAFPLLSAFLFPIPFCSSFVSLYLLGTLLAVIGSRPPRSQVARKLLLLFKLFIQLSSYLRIQYYNMMIRWRTYLKRLIFFLSGLALSKKKKKELNQNEEGAPRHTDTHIFK